MNLKFTNDVFETTMGGVSAIDLRRLHVHQLSDAHNFIRSYGYDVTSPHDSDRIWSFHRRAITFIREEVLETDEAIPEELSDSNRLGDIGNLLVAASITRSSSSAEEKERQRWACAILRVMHVFAHLDNDLFFEFSDQIQDQVLKPFRDVILNDGATGLTLGLMNQSDQIHLHRFDVKPFKASVSSVIKLLTKPQAVALNLLDKVGLRFVTRDLFDCFRVIRFLAQEGLVSFPNIMPDQSRNTLYPLNLFNEVLKENELDTRRLTEVPGLLERKWDEAAHRAEFMERRNDFSGSDFRAVKFISRALIRVDAGGRPLRFFFPYEIQVVDQMNYQKHLTGESSHNEYKSRQRAAARLRILGMTSFQKEKAQ